MTPSATLTPAAALALGWSVIPCGRDKRPLLEAWKPFQTRRPTVQEVENWMRIHPATWAMITGEISDRITLDFDGESGRQILDGLHLAPHRCTPSGGFHCDFRYPGWRVKTLNSKTDRELQKRYPGLDIRGDGGYAIVSGHTDCGAYTWLRDPEPYALDILPTDMREFFGLLHPPAAPIPMNGKPHSIPGNGRVDAEQLVHRALDRLDGRNNSGMWLAIQLRDNDYSQGEAECAMRNYRGRCRDVNTKGEREEYTEGEMLATLREAYSRTARDPWEPKKATSMPASAATPSTDSPPVKPAKAKRPAPDVPVLGIEDLLKLDIPAPEMLIEKLQVKRGAQLCVGASKSCKTIMGVQKALAIATGKPLFGYYTVKQGGAMIVEQDDPGGAASIKTIVQKAGITGGIPLFVVPKVPFSLGLAFVDWLEKEIADKFLRYVLLDSYTALRSPHTAGVDIVKAESGTLKLFDELGKRAGCAIEIIHHTSKGSAHLDWSENAGGTFAMGHATEGQTHISRFRELDNNAPERLVRIRLRHGADVEMLLRFRADTLDLEWVMEGGASEYYPLIRQLQTAFGEQTFTPKEMTHEIGVAKSTAHRIIDSLHRAGALEKRAYGQYALSHLKL
jgi:hypothetical protein